MIFDQKNLFSDQQAITATAVSTNVIDTGANGTPYGAGAALGRDQGKGCVLPLFIGVTENFATLTSLTATVQHSDDNSSFSDVLGTPAIPVATLKAGYQFPIDSIPLTTTKRYIRLNYTVAGSNATAGKITAGITMGNQTAQL